MGRHIFFCCKPLFFVPSSHCPCARDAHEKKKKKKEQELTASYLAKMSVESFSPLRLDVSLISQFCRQEEEERERELNRMFPLEAVSNMFLA